LGSNQVRITTVSDDAGNSLPFRPLTAPSSDPGRGQDPVTEAISTTERSANHEQTIASYAATGRPDLAIEAARRFVELPTHHPHIDSVREVCALVAGIAPGSAIQSLLEAQADSETTGESAVERFTLAADLARYEGDPHIDAVATFRAIQAAAAHGPLPPSLVERLGGLSSAVPFAAGVYAHIRSQLLQADGDGRGAMEVISGPDDLTSEILVIRRAGRLCDLGWPEEVFAGLGPNDLAGLPEGVEVLAAFAMWLRGEVSPEDGLVLGSAMIPDIVARGATQPAVAILSAVTFVALAAGDLDAARSFRSQLSKFSAKGDARTSLFLAMVDAAITSTEGNESAAAIALDPSVTGTPHGRWPARSHLLGISLLYVSCPEARSMLDSCQFGPALSTAVAAGRALVELRETGFADDSIALPWSNPLVLRAHVLPHHLCELAAAAASEGNDEARMLLDSLPTRHSSLTRLAATAKPKLSRWAAQHQSLG